MDGNMIRIEWKAFHHLHCVCCRIHARLWQSEWFSYFPLKLGETFLGWAWLEFQRMHYSLNTNSLASISTEFSRLNARCVLHETHTNTPFGRAFNILAAWINRSVNVLCVSRRLSSNRAISFSLTFDGATCFPWLLIFVSPFQMENDWYGKQQHR